MKCNRMAIAASFGVLLTAASVATAQAPTVPSQAQPHGGAHAPAQQPQQPMTGHMGQRGQDQMSMMCSMMGSGRMSGGMMAGRMMGGGMIGTGDPKSQARILKLRGDMMKAMGDVLLKHAQEVEQAK